MPLLKSNAAINGSRMALAFFKDSLPRILVAALLACTPSVNALAQDNPQSNYPGGKCLKGTWTPGSRVQN